MAGAVVGSLDLNKAQKFLKDEWQHPGKRAANLRLLWALSVFTTGVVVARQFGEALFVS